LRAVSETEGLKNNGETATLFQSGSRGFEMAEVKDRLNAKQAIEAGFQLFQDFFDKADTSRVLLEGLEYLESDGEWLVTIGFDAGRKKETSSSFGFGERTLEPVREKRQFFLNAKDGSLLRMH
jgi:hypothetical protein